MTNPICAPKVIAICREDVPEFGNKPLKLLGFYRVKVRLSFRDYALELFTGPLCRWRWGFLVTYWRCPRDWLNVSHDGTIA
jgi:hypothetical protein